MPKLLSAAEVPQVSLGSFPLDFLLALLLLALKIPELVPKAGSPAAVQPYAGRPSTGYPRRRQIFCLPVCCQDDCTDTSV